MCQSWSTRVTSSKSDFSSGVYLRRHRVIFLSCPPVSEKMLVESARTYEAYLEMCTELSHTDPSFKVIDLLVQCKSAETGLIHALETEYTSQQWQRYSRQ